MHRAAWRVWTGVVRVLLSAPRMVRTRASLRNPRERGAAEVDQAEGGPVAGLALPAEERAGDLPGGVHALLDVDGEGEEVRPLPHRTRGGGRDQHHRVAHADGHGAVGEAGQLAGFEGQGLVSPGDGTGYGVILRHWMLSSGTRLRVPLCGAASSSRCRHPSGTTLGRGVGDWQLNRCAVLISVEPATEVASRGIVSAGGRVAMRAR